jgi:hypothetical protein
MSSKIYFRNAKEIDKIIKNNPKFHITESLTKTLISSLTTKIFFTLTRGRAFDEMSYSLNIGKKVTVIPYKWSMSNTSIRFIIKISNFFEADKDRELIIFWDGKFAKTKNDSTPFSFHNITVNVENLDLSKPGMLDYYTVIEQEIVAELQIMDGIKHGGVDIEEQNDRT